MQSDIDKLAKIISYILFLRLILVIIIISIIFNMAIKKPVVKLMPLYSFVLCLEPHILIDPRARNLFFNMLKAETQQIYFLSQSISIRLYLTEFLNSSLDDMVLFMTAITS